MASLFRRNRGRFRTEIAVSAMVIGSVTAAVGVSTAVAAPDYPTWDDVQNAKRDEASTAAKIDELNGLVSGLQASADSAARAQQIAAERYQIATDALNAATSRERDLADKAAAAEERARQSKMRAGLLAAHLARTAGNSDVGLNLALSGADSDDLLYQLGTMTKLSEQSQTIYDAAIADRKEAASLSEQASIATTERTAKAAAAEAALATARSASETAASALAEQESRQNELFAQLATLKDTSADTEKAYQQGLSAEKEQQESSAPSAPAPPAPPPINQPGPVAPPVVDKVASALAFARAQFGEPYVFAGAGPDEWDCSGLTMRAYEAAGVDIGTHSATNQYNTARNRGQLVPYSQAQAGDLIFYSEDGSDMYHVAIYSGGGMMIEAPYEGRPVREVAVRSYERVAYVARPTA